MEIVLFDIFPGDTSCESANRRRVNIESHLFTKATDGPGATSSPNHLLEKFEENKVLGLKGDIGDVDDLVPSGIKTSSFDS